MAVNHKPRDYFEAWNEMQQVCGKRCNWMASLENCDCHKKAELAAGMNLIKAAAHAPSDR